MNKRIFILFCLIFCTIFAFAQSSKSEENAINDMNFFRMELEKYSNPQEILDKVSDYETSLFANENYKNFSEETKLILENMLFLEKLKNQVKLIENDKTAKNQLKAETQNQIKKTADYINSLNSNEKTANKWLLVNQGDLISFSLQFASLSEAIKSGLEVKTYYEDALKQDEKMSFALVNLGMWYYYVPGIAGGDKQKTYDFVKKSVTDATNDSELYFAKIIYSQTLFEQGNFEESKTELEQAKKLCSESQNIKFMEKLNNAGISYIDYSGNPKKYDKKLGN
jgi:hypothetical protein